MPSTKPVEQPTINPLSESPLLIEQQPGQFNRDFNKNSFPFLHTLANDPRFSYQRFIELVERHSRLPASINCNIGKVQVDQSWGTVKNSPSPADVARNMHNSEGWMILYHVERDPEFSAVLDHILKEIESLTGPQLRGDILLRKAEVIISSPNRVTFYHMDREANWLIQLHGSKTAYVFDPKDKDVLTDQELENYFSGNIDAAIYKEHLQCRSAHYEMTPGTGVHMPVTAPHWVQNGPTVSVSIAFNLHLRSSFHEGMIYRFNKYLRRLGLSPKTPNPRSLFDYLKGIIFTSVAYGIKTVKKATRRKEKAKYS
jgi:hypothetical protein